MRFHIVIVKPFTPLLPDHQRSVQLQEIQRTSQEIDRTVEIASSNATPSSSSKAA